VAEIDVAQAAIMARQRAMFQAPVEDRGPVMLGSMSFGRR
jgi:hypothetical protein